MKTIQDELKQTLLADRDAWASRLAAIRRDRRHEVVPLEADSEDRAIQRENDEALDGLDARGHQALSEISAALSRIEAGDYGVCVRCGEPIPEARLRAQPTAATCVDCSASSKRD